VHNDPNAADGRGDDSLVFERLPNGEFAWLRPETGPSPLAQYAQRIALATRFVVLPHGWTFVDVAPIALEDLQP
jgi:hypothetical protein